MSLQPYFAMSVSHGFPQDHEVYFTLEEARYLTARYHIFEYLARFSRVERDNPSITLFLRTTARSYSTFYGPVDVHVGHLLLNTVAFTNRCAGDPPLVLASSRVGSGTSSVWMYGLWTVGLCRCWRRTV